MKEMTKDEKEWRAQDDAYTLVRLAEIMSDKERYEAALDAAKEIAKDKKKEIENLEKIQDGVFDFPGLE